MNRLFSNELSPIDSKLIAHASKLQITLLKMAEDDRIVAGFTLEGAIDPEGDRQERLRRARSAKRRAAKGLPPKPRKPQDLGWLKTLIDQFESASD